MRYSLWMLNSALALFFIGVLILIFATRPTLPPRKSLIPSTPLIQKEEEAPKISLATIYEKDPFGTISAATETKPKPAQYQLEPVPLPPSMPQNAAPPTPQPQFLPPLSILLKGVIFSERDQGNRAIIADKKTKTERLYKVGDSILDAEIIRIESNKIMVLRSTGQQETIFVSAADAHHDPLYQQFEHKSSTINQAVRQQGPAAFTIDPAIFTETITNLAQLIESLDITTVYEQGRGIGCRIGIVSPGSLGSLLGLQTHDIITRINNISPGTASDRLAIYEQIRHMHLDDTIVVQLTRNQQQLQITYLLDSFTARKRAAMPAAQPSAGQPPSQPPAPMPQRSQPRTVFAMPPQQTSMRNPATQPLQKLEKHGMFENGGRSGMLRSSRP